MYDVLDTKQKRSSYTNTITNESPSSKLRGISGFQFLVTKQASGNVTRRDLISWF
jgi:hypothetical protein